MIFRSFFLVIVCSFVMQADALVAQRGIIGNQGTKSLSLGGISASLTGVDALLNNFSAITSESNQFSGIVSSDRRFELEELTSAIIGFHIPTRKLGHFGLIISNYGFSEYKEQKFSIAYARKIGSNLAISGNFDLNTFRIKEFGNTTAFSFGFGLYGQLIEDISYGLYIFNPEKIEITKDTEIPTSIRFSVSKMFSKDLAIYTEVEKTIDEDINFKLGIDYKLIDQLRIRIGFNTNPGSFAFGLLYKISNTIQIEGGTQYDTLLGNTPGVSLKYSGASIQT